MASEALYVPEEHLHDVIKVIRVGLAAGGRAGRIKKEVREQLNKWCNEEEDYLKRLEEG